MTFVFGSDTFLSVRFVGFFCVVFCSPFVHDVEGSFCLFLISNFYKTVYIVFCFPFSNTSASHLQTPNLEQKEEKHLPMQESHC